MATSLANMGNPSSKDQHDNTYVFLDEPPDKNTAPENLRYDDQTNPTW
jgi:hypothetical protein